MTANMVSIGDYVDVVSGPAFKSERFTDDPNDVPLIKGENIGQGYIVWEKSKYWPVGDADSFERFEIEANDIVLAMDRPWVTSGLKWAQLKHYEPRSLLVQRVARLRARNGLKQNFLAHIIGSAAFSDYVRNIMGGTNVPHISGSQIKAFKFRMPSDIEQAKIAEVLSSYDNLIENNRRRIALLEEGTLMLYREWFVRLRFPGHEHTKISNGVPDGWELSPLGSILNLQRGFDLPIDSRHPGNVPVYGSTGIVGKHNVAKVEFPTLITGRSGSLGTVCFSDQPCWPLNTSLWVTEFKRASVYLSYFILKEMNLAKFNGGASVPTLDRKVVHATTVLLPPPPLASLFDDAVKEIFAQKRILLAQSSKLAEARDLLLPRLMSGEIAV